MGAQQPSLSGGQAARRRAARKAASAGLHRRGGRGAAAAVPQALSPLYLTGGCKSPIANSYHVPRTASRLGLKDFGTAQQKM